MKVVIIQAPPDSKISDFTTFDLQIEILTAVVALCK